MAEITREQLTDIFFPEELKENEKDINFSLPIRWEGKDFYKELYLLLKEYQTRIGNRLTGGEYEKIRDDVRKVCHLVCLAVSESFHGNPSRAYDAVDEALQLLTGEYPCYIGVKELIQYPLYRAVDVGDKAMHDRKRVFHVPFNMRHKMSTNRYSIPGYPALYLGTSIGLNCEEIHKSPQADTVMAARFVYDSVDEEVAIWQFQKQPCLIDLSVKPQDFQKFREFEKLSTRQKLLMSDVDGESTHTLLKRPEFYLLWYPLIDACSFIRIYREDPYSPEYVVPQLVSQWVKKMEMPPKDEWFFKRKVLCGVCYFSCLSEKASEKGLNFAFPSSGNDVWTFDKIKNYCPVLAANFKLTEPVFVSEYESPDECEEALSSLETARIGKFSVEAIEKEIESNANKYVIPDGEDTIPDFTFYSIEKLNVITIPNSVTSVGNGAFAGCTGLSKIEIPNSVTSIGYWAFNGCNGLTSIEIPNSVTSIGDEAFNGCTGLTSIEIPNNVMSIGKNIVYGCSNLREITVSKANDRYCGINNCIIDKNTGELICGCKDSTIPVDGSVTSIGEEAFHRCAGVICLKIPNSVISIGDGAFQDCIGLTSIEIPNSVTNIGNMAFDGCISLPSIVIPNSVTSIGYMAFRDCTGLTYLEIPNSVISIGAEAFADCKNLDILVPRRFVNLNNDAFKGCKSVTPHDS